MARFPAAYFCIKAFSETDLTEDLKKFDVPTLILHGDDDQIVPIADSALLSSKLVKGATLKVYKGASHGLCTTLKDEINKDLLAFIQGMSLPGRHRTAGAAHEPSPRDVSLPEPAGALTEGVCRSFKYMSAASSARPTPFARIMMMSFCSTPYSTHSARPHANNKSVLREMSSV